MMSRMNFIVWLIRYFTTTNPIIVEDFRSSIGLTRRFPSMMSVRSTCLRTLFRTMNSRRFWCWRHSSRRVTWRFMGFEEVDFLLQSGCGESIWKKHDDMWSKLVQMNFLQFGWDDYLWMFFCDDIPNKESADYLFRDTGRSTMEFDDPLPTNVLSHSEDSCNDYIAGFGFLNKFQSMTWGLRSALCLLGWFVENAIGFK